MKENKIDLNVIQANQYVHSCLVKMKEYNKSPHFRPENQKKVRNILIRLQSLLDKKEQPKLIDFGCGTGFIINLAHDLFFEVHGVDITKEMLDQVETSYSNVFLHEGLAEETEFEDEFFDFATAYSFMDHLGNYEIFLEEVYRVLKKGGIFYSDLNPNKSFINELHKIDQHQEEFISMSTIVCKEVKGALYNGKHYAENFGIDETILLQAEPIKSIQQGFDAIEVLQTGYEIGFSKCLVEYEWFMGEGTIIHSKDFSHAEIIREYLDSVKPFSSMFFKYLRFIFIK
jgi:ubiquinone/menaquinone biosynthesis C-methylase UbiE